MVREVAADARAGDDLWGRTRFTDEPTEPDDVDLGADTVGAIAALLDEAPSSQREAIALAFIGELSPTEIATHLHMTAETVEGRIRFGLEELRERNYKSPGTTDTEN